MYVKTIGRIYDLRCHIKLINVSAAIGEPYEEIQ